MKITEETKKKLIEDFHLDPKEPFELKFEITITQAEENVEGKDGYKTGNLVAYAGTFADVNGYDERKVVGSTEDIINFFSSYIKSVLE